MTYVDDMTITTDNELMRNEVFDAINSVVEVKDVITLLATTAGTACNVQRLLTTLCV
jgi:hypothetical protein